MFHTHTSYYNKQYDMIYLELRLSWVFMICVALQPINLSNQPAKKNRKKKCDPQPYCQNSESENGK